MNHPDGRFVFCHGGCGTYIGRAWGEMGYVTPRYGCADCRPARDPRYIADRIVDSLVANGYRLIKPILNLAVSKVVARALRESMTNGKQSPMQYSGPRKVAI